MINLSGKVVGRLTVISFSHYKQTASGSRQYFWNCVCACGSEVKVDGCCLRRESTTSCGCYCRERSTTHGAQKNGAKLWREYSVWLAIKQRCRNKESSCYPYYGGRGIDICQDWFDDFSKFIEHIGPSPSKLHTIERIDNNRGYEPGNVRWATRSEQNENTRQTRLISFGGITQSIGKWSRCLGISRACIRHRMDILKLPVEEVLTSKDRRSKR